MPSFHPFSRSRILKKTLFIGGCLMCGYAAAQPSITPTNPGVSLYGMAGNGWTGIGDMMLPIIGQPLNFTFIDPQIYFYGSHEYTLSGGLGQRWLTPNAGILGAHVFGDYNKAPDGEFWFVSPGIEHLGETFDFSANVYIPVGDQRSATKTTFADNVGDYSQVTFSGHTQFDELVNTFESTGWGADAQVGVRTRFRNSKIYLGGYYFDPKDSSSITGGAIRAEVPINNYLSALMSEAYDSEFHNTVKVGLTLWFGGRNTGLNFNGNLAERIVDPVQRSLAGVAGGAHNAEPVVNNVQDTGQTGVELTNISFFVPEATAADPGAVQGNGTYENPYQGMSQDNVDDANTQNNRNFYINSGTYDAVYNPLVNPDYILLDNDQLYGRTNYFKAPAQGSSRPVINFTAGGFEIPGGNTDSFTGLQIEGDGITSGTAGIFVNHDSGSSTTVTINNSSIKMFGDGVDIYNNTASDTLVNIYNSVISNNFGGGADPLLFGPNGGYGGGIAALNNGAGQMTLNVSNSQVNDNTNGALVSNWGGIGVYNYGSGTVTFNASKDDIVNNIPITSPVTGAIVLDNEGTGVLNADIEDSYISGSDNGISAISGFYNPLNSNSLSLTINRSTITGNDNAGVVMANFGPNNVNLNIYQSTLSNNNTDGIEVFNLDNGDVVVNVQNSYLVNNDNNGFLANNFSDGNITVNMFGDSVSGNLIGLSFENLGASGDINVKVINSDIESNFNGIQAANNGGTGNLNLTVENSTIKDNDNIGIDFRVVNNVGDNTLTVNNSIITGNEVGVQGTVITGLFAGPSSDALTVNINNSLISDNGIGVSLSSFAFAANSQTQITANITGSIITNNETGVLANSQKSPLATSSDVLVTIDHSIMAGNIVALDSQGVGIGALSTIIVTNPLYFNGIVNFSGTGNVVFPDVTPANGDRVFCTPFGCTIL